ncbi:protein-disulfide reductase DsbD family protein [Spirochaetota bacterium]
MKIKILKRISIILPLVILFSCGVKKYSENKVFPKPKKIKAAIGSSSFISLKVEIPHGYHIYGNPKGPGIGKPTTVIAKGPDFISFKPTRFLGPKKYFYPGDKNFVWVYEHETTMFIPFNVKPSARMGNHEINIQYESLICDVKTCVIKNFSFKYPIEIIEKGKKGTTHDKEIIEQYKISSTPKMLKGIIKKDIKKETHPSSKNYELKSIKFEPRYLEKSKITGLIQAIIFGLIAGFILNFMPCVLPVVSLKIVSFVKHADKNKKELTILGFIFAGGILSCFTILATLAAFLGYNWGSLFQHRLFIIIMTSIIFILALEMFHLFTFNVPSFTSKSPTEKKNSYTDAFTKGILATILATPCSGPFLGGTLAWALTQTPLKIFIIFMSVGIGMALPYLILTINPRLTRFIPKPGEWMKTFESVMGFLLIFTAVYLINILDSQSVMPMITFMGFIAIAFWQYGRWGSIIQSNRSRIVSAIFLILLIVSGYFISFNFIFDSDKTSKIKSLNFSVEKLINNRKIGKATIIKFTADWCPNCKLVEKISLNTSKVIESMKKNRIELFTADLTRKNDAAQKLMEQLGSRSIPFLAIIPGGESFNKPVCLRDIYSEDDVLKAIEMAVKK